MESVKLTHYDAVPPGLLDLPASRLGEVLPGPALIHLPGRRSPPLFVSVLLHGNEDTGWLAAQTVLKKYAAAELPRALSLYIGNVAAARSGVRRLDGQPDYNRVWLGSEEPDSAETAMMLQVVDAMRARGVFASLDIHNNTGLNPHYACVNRLEPNFLHLATLFSRVVVYFIRPLGVQSAAFAELCPSVTLEFGKPGTPGSVDHA
ncbi:MAG: M14 family metallopeptidase, partial [Thiobacillus sp.]|nr:M14 family metallopeptidase [Thiobacillus sp.]